MRVGQKGGVTTPCDPNEAKNAQKPQARRKNRKKYSNTCDARVITTPYSNPRKESIPPPQKRTELVTAIPRTRSLTSGLAEPNSWAGVALTANALPNTRMGGRRDHWLPVQNTQSQEHTALASSYTWLGFKDV